MWIAIVVFVAAVFTALLTLLGGGIYTIIGVPIAFVIAAFFLASFLGRGRDTPQVVDPPEPTGTPRKASGDAETANERVGQA